MAYPEEPNMTVVLVDATNPQIGVNLVSLGNGVYGLAMSGGSSTPGGSQPSTFTEVGGVYNSPAPTATNGATYPLQLDNRANLEVTLGTTISGEDLPNNVLGEIRKYVISQTYSRTPYFSNASVGAFAKSSAGQLVSVIASNAGAAVVYLQIFNSASGPTGTPVLSLPIAAGTSTAPSVLILDDTFFGPNGLYLSSGISFGFSTTASTYTAGTAANYTFNATVV